MPAASPRKPAPEPAADAILALNNIEVVYDRVILVLKGVSLSVQRGGIVALLGANGAGKTTTLKAISGLLMAERGQVTKGTIELDGARLERYALEHQDDAVVDDLDVVDCQHGCERSDVIVPTLRDRRVGSTRNPPISRLLNPPRSAWSADRNRRGTTQSP